jgi:spore germination protein YaaH
MKFYVPLFLALLGLSNLAPVSAVAGSPAALSDDPTHPVAMQQAATQVAGAKLGVLQPFVAPAQMPAIGGNGGPQREVFGFALASSLSDPSVGYPTWNFSLLSTVAFFGLHVNDDGTFASDSGWNVWNSSQLTGLLSTAHSRGTKVVLTIIMQDFSANTPHMCSALTHVATTVANTAAEVKAKGVDGVNVDYEGLNGSCGSPSDPSWARHNFTSFVGSLRSTLPGGSYLSVDTYASSATDPQGFFDIGGLAGSADSFFVMAYDLEYANYRRAPLNCSSFCLGPTAPLAGYYYNDTATASQYVSVVAASKVILGVPYYGRKACVASPAPNAYPTSSVSADTYLDASQEATAPGPGFQPGSFVAHRDANDPAGQERWDTWFNTSFNCTRELYWDDVFSLGNKYDLVNSANLRGVGIWNLNYGGGASELWNELNLKFGAGAAHRIGGSITSGPDASSWGASRTDVFVRGTENGLWQTTWNGTTWSWTFLGGVINADPSAVSWGTNRIDVFVRGADNALWHRSSDGISWATWEKLGGVITSGPDAVSTSPGHLDVFARGTEGGLWRVSWNGTTWSWTFVGGRITSDPGAVSSGSNRIDVFVRGTENGLWQTTWNGTSWSWTFLGGVLSTGPDAASCASGHLDVFALGTDNALWQRGFNGTTWNPWQRIGGPWTADPGAVCPAGTTSVNVFERGPDGSLWEMLVPGS